MGIARTLYEVHHDGSVYFATGEKCGEGGGRGGKGGGSCTLKFKV